jgi:endonuclease/exonuclease/phosphatase family metal-dependent hydrolase
MRRFLFALGLSTGLAACPGTQRDLSQATQDAEPDPPDATLDVSVGPTTARVVTWNVRNLYNDVRDSLEVDVANETILTPAEYQQKLDDIAAVLNGLTPDVVVLQEVENQNVISDLAAKLGGLGHLHITQGNDPRGIDIAMLSRFPIDQVVSHAQETFSSSATGQNFKFARDVLEAHLTIGPRHVIFFGVHFKSGGTAEDIDKRLAESEQTRKLVTQAEGLDPSAASIVLGDFNFNMTANTPALAALSGSTPALVSATSGLAAQDRFSVTFGGNPQLYDEQLIDPDAFAALDPASVLIQHGSAVDAAADHDPVAASYVFE